jgi:hypothetical protein
MDARVKPGHDEWRGSLSPVHLDRLHYGLIKSFARSTVAFGVA